MKKKVFLGIVLIFALILSSFAYATVDNTTIHTDLIDNTVPSNSADSENGIMPISENSATTPVGEEEGSEIPEEWRRTGETGETDETAEGEDYSIPEEWLRTEQEMVSGSVARAGEDVTVENLSIDGSLFIAGSNINVSNVTVYGDVFVAGDNITFTNVAVVGSLFSVGSNVNMTNTEVGISIFNASSTFNFAGGASDIYAFASKMMFGKNTTIYRDLGGCASEVELVGTSVERNANLSTDSLKITEASAIDGKLNYSANEEAEISADSTVSNPEFTKNEMEPSSAVNDIARPKTIVLNILSIVIKSAIICGFICLSAKGFIERQKVENSVKYISISTLKGLLWTIVIPVVATLLLFTGVTFGLSFIIFALYFIIFTISVPIVSTAVAVAFCKEDELNNRKVFGYSLVVTFVIAILKQVPQISFVVSVVVGIAAMGILIASLKKTKAVKVEEKTVTEEVEK